MLVAHEGTDDIRPGRDDPGFAGRDTSQPRCPVRSPVTRGVAGSRGDELPGGREGSGRLSWNGRKLGAWFRASRVRRFERGRANGPAEATGPKGYGEGRDGATSIPSRLRAVGASVGRALVVGFCAEAVRGDPEGTPVSTPLSSVGFPAAQTAPGDSPSRPATAGGGKKNSVDSPSTLRSISGRWTKSISSSTAAGAVCGFLLKSRTRFVAMRQPANSSATLAPSGSGMDGWSLPSSEGRFDAQTLLVLSSSVAPQKPKPYGRRVIVIIDNARYPPCHSSRREWRRLQRARFHPVVPAALQPEPQPNRGESGSSFASSGFTIATSRLSLNSSQLVDRQFATWGRANSTLRKLCSV